MFAPAGFSLTTIRGVPVVGTPPEIDIANAGELGERPAIAIRPRRPDPHAEALARANAAT